MPELKPCPFCGARDADTTDIGTHLWVVKCSACLSSGPVSWEEELAIAAWNGPLEAALAQLTEERDRYKRALEIIATPPDDCWHYDVAEEALVDDDEPATECCMDRGAEDCDDD